MMKTTSRVYIIAILALSLVILCCGEKFNLTELELRKYFNTTISRRNGIPMRVKEIKQNVVNHTKTDVMMIMMIL